ncbi:hypothetical protein HELRODRAFT_67029 [Helobdella robusta]|uniref:G-protein coupled receptors family 2 profile 2 domain-containing protein n=1 Tax=Helobdella robusta TaxID=6412 RepID=T1FYV4_HELRO|nr:hypothetical protein HELRODRAFT_67029 [Helobdella robusta]ESN99464.1 hypothetical protein HELRODRAFT_67029 [Helobdella robusta]
MNDSGYWSDEGCTLKISNETHTTCTCNHLTNFAILFSPYRAVLHEKILSMISLVGCIVSIVSLVLTIIFYAIRIVKSKQAAILINLCASLIIANIIFLAGVNQTSNKNGCTAVAILLHYFFLVSFFIMLVIAIHLIFNVFLVFHSLTKRNITMMIVFAWGKFFEILLVCVAFSCITK